MRDVDHIGQGFPLTELPWPDFLQAVGNGTEQKHGRLHQEPGEQWPMPQGQRAEHG